MKTTGRLSMMMLLLLCMLLPACSSIPVRSVKEPIRLFDGKSLDSFYTYLRDRGRDTDPNNVFTVADGVIRISGQEWGCLTTHEAFADYHLIAEYKWGEKTYPPRENRARDSGIMLHSAGKDGSYNGVWIHSIECQIIEGGTGDLLCVGDGSFWFALTCPVRDEKCAGHYVFQPDGKPVTIHRGRINWFGRDPAWRDVLGFRGSRDIERPLGRWNRLECIVQGKTITVILNGVVVNRCLDVRPRSGQLQIQSESAEIFFRRFDLLPLEQ